MVLAFRILSAATRFCATAKTVVLSFFSQGATTRASALRPSTTKGGAPTGFAGRAQPRLYRGLRGRPTMGRPLCAVVLRVYRLGNLPMAAAAIGARLYPRQDHRALHVHFNPALWN